MLIKHNGFIQGKIVHSTSKILFREDAFFVTGNVGEIQFKFQDYFFVFFSGAQLRIRRARLAHNLRQSSPVRRCLTRNEGRPLKFNRINIFGHGMLLLFAQLFECQCLTYFYYSRYLLQ